jgi:hypothetical protein
VANVSQIVTVDRGMLTKRAGRISERKLGLVLSRIGTGEERLHIPREREVMSWEVSRS